MHTTVKSLLAVIGAAIMGTACSNRQADSTSPRLTGDHSGSTAVSGTWANSAIGPYYRESMTLTQTGDHVSGTGTYAIEAGRTGPTTIDGMLTGKTVTLAITRDYGLVETFTGSLTDATHLTGTLAMDGSKGAFSYVRQ